jgi:hypothetical protein
MADLDPPPHGTLPSAREDVARVREVPATPQTVSSSYRLAFSDHDFLLRPELRPVRLQLELLKPELELRARGIESTIVTFGSARIMEPEAARARREAAEARNQGEQLVYQTEKFLKDNEDKVPGEIKTEVEGAIGELKDALKGEDTAEIRTATEKVAAVSQKLGQAMYADAQSSQAAAGGAAGASAPTADAEVVPA